MPTPMSSPKGGVASFGACLVVRRPGPLSPIFIVVNQRDTSVWHEADYALTSFSTPKRTLVAKLRGDGTPKRPSSSIQTERS